MKIPLLNAGFVRLVSYMQPVPETLPVGEGHAFDSRMVERQIRPKGWTGDLEVVRNARVSYNADWRTANHLEHEPHCTSLLPPMSNGEARPCCCTPAVRSDEKLINFMMREHHTSPFESMVFTFEVKAPIFIFRQWHRHRTWSYNEISGRYSELEREYYVPRQEHIGVQDPHNKQARIIHRDILAIAELDRQQRMVEGFDIEASQSHERYGARLEEGVPRELARINLPLSTYSRMFATVDLHNLFHFLHLRLHKHAQWEIRQYALALVDLITPIVPVSTGAFINSLPFDDYGLRFSYSTPESKTLAAGDTGS